MRAEIVSHHSLWILRFFDEEKLTIGSRLLKILWREPNQNRSAIAFHNFTAFERDHDSHLRRDI